MNNHVQWGSKNHQKKYNDRNIHQNTRKTKKLEVIQAKRRSNSTKSLKQQPMDTKYTRKMQIQDNEC